MKIMDEKGRLFGKINLFDLIALMVLVLGLLVIGLRLTGGEEEAVAPAYSSATVQIESTGMRDYMVESLKEGDLLYEENKKIGVIKEIRAEKQKVDTLLPDGSYQAIERVLFYDVMLTIETEQYYEDAGQYVNGALLLNGTSHTFSTGKTQFDAIVWEIVPGKEK